MRIGIDARWILPEVSGIGTHALALIEELPRVDRDNEYVLFFNRPAVRDHVMTDVVGAAGPRFTAHDLPFSPFSPASQLVLLPRLEALRLDVFHSLGYMIPGAIGSGQAGRSLRLLSTIHDVIPLVMPPPAPATEDARRLERYRSTMTTMARHADAILTCSEQSRRDIARLLLAPGADEAKLIVVPLGVSRFFHPPDNRVRARHEILCVGRADPHKNLAALIDALVLVRRHVPAARLRAIGFADARVSALRRYADSVGVGHAVSWDGYVAPADLLAAYQHASVLAFPSHYEGFGLPALEAMACGLPVVCSRTAALPEVADGAALTIDPVDTDALAEALIRVLTQAELADDLSERGLRRAAEWSWTRSAELTVRAYARIATA